MATVNAQELFVNIRKATRLLYEYQRRIQGTMFEIKSRLNLNPTGRIGINKLFSNPPTMNKSGYGQFQLWPDRWAWDFLFPMMMEYYLGDRETANGKHSFCLSIIQVTDTGFFKAKKEGAPSHTDTETFYDVALSDTIALFVMELKPKTSDWSEKWKHIDLENIEAWLNHNDAVIEITETGSYFVVMQRKWSDLMSKDDITIALSSICNQMSEITGCDLTKAH